MFSDSMNFERIASRQFFEGIVHITARDHGERDPRVVLVLGQLACNLLVDELPIGRCDPTTPHQQIGQRFRFVRRPGATRGRELREVEQFAFVGQHGEQQMRLGGSVLVDRTCFGRRSIWCHEPLQLLTQLWKSRGVVTRIRRLARLAPPVAVDQDQLTEQGAAQRFRNAAEKACDVWPLTACPRMLKSIAYGFHLNGLCLFGLTRLRSVAHRHSPLKEFKIGYRRSPE